MINTTPENSTQADEKNIAFTLDDAVNMVRLMGQKLFSKGIIVADTASRSWLDDLGSQVRSVDVLQFPSYDKVKLAEGKPDIIPVDADVIDKTDPYEVQEFIDQQYQRWAIASNVGKKHTVWQSFLDDNGLIVRDANTMSQVQVNGDPHDQLRATDEDLQEVLDELVRIHGHKLPEVLREKLLR